MPEAGCGGGGGMSSKEKLESNAKSPTGTRVTSEEGRGNSGVGEWEVQYWVQDRLKDVLYNMQNIANIL